MILLIILGNLVSSNHSSITNTSIPVGKKHFTLSKDYINLNPFWVSGFSDAEGCFSVILTKLPKGSWRIIVSFEINLHTKDIDILYQIQKFWGVGLVHSRVNRNLCVFRVTKIEDLIKVIIPHFKKFALLSQKHSDFILWSKVVELMHTKTHLTTLGVMTILGLYSSINLGVSSRISPKGEAFPNIVGVKRESVILPLTLNPYWVSGFTAGDGGFSIGIRKITGQIYFRFHIAQHSRDRDLMILFISFFGCGKVNRRENRCDYYIQDFAKIYEIVLPHFTKYPLHNIKTLDFLDFKKAAELYNKGGKENTEDITKIISNMNSKRVNGIS